MSRQDLFDITWIELSEEHHCDTWGSAEFRRVLKEWLAAGKPVCIRAFILQAANRPPDNPASPANAGDSDEGIDLREIGREIGELPNDTL